MSLFQRADVYQNANYWHPAFRSSGVMNGDLSEGTKTKTDEVFIRNVPDDVTGTLDLLERAAPDEQVPKYVNSEKWCGDQRTQRMVLKVEVTSLFLLLSA